MTRLYEFLIALAIVLALFLLVGLVLPSERHLEESVETNRRMTIVHDTLNNVRRLKDWNALIPANSDELKYSGGSDGHTGVGARVDYDSAIKYHSQGSWEITESRESELGGDAGKIVFAITDSKMGDNKRSTFTLEPTGKNDRNVKITQSYDVDYGWNLFGRYMGMYVGRNIGDQMKGSLSKLSNMLSSVPNHDYRTPGTTLRDLRIVDLPAEDLLVVNAGNIDRNNEVIKGQINSNLEWIKRVMESNNLEAAGPLRIITTDFGTEKYAFDVAQPVRRKDPKEGDSGSLTVKVTDTPVEHVHLEPRKSASANYTGYMAELDVVRNSLRAWAVTAGHEVVDRPYESWKKGVDDSFQADGEFEVFWAIKQ